MILVSNLHIVIVVLAGILGIIVGSFLNVVILRHGTGRNVGGRSICMSCGTVLHWYELIPVISFIVQQRRCRTCFTSISWQYPMVELLTSALFIAVAIAYLPAVFYSWWWIIPLLFGFILISLFILIAVYDVRHLIMPDIFVWSFVGLAALSLFVPMIAGVSSILFDWPTLEALFAGPLIALPFLALWLLSGGRLIGLGDVKFMLGTGWLLGLGEGLFALCLSFWLGTLVIGLIALIRYALHKLRFRGIQFARILPREIPFAPFLVAGTIIVFLYGEELLALFFNL